jgi:hypothetical protein
MTFHDLHYKESPLLLPNAWDAGSAIAFADEGFPPIGTTNYGVGAAAGHPDGARASRDATSRLVWSLAGLPAYVWADIEDGYSDDPGEVGGYVAAQGWAFDRAGASRAERDRKPVGFPSAVVPWPGPAAPRRVSGIRRGAGSAAGRCRPAGAVGGA